LEKWLGDLADFVVGMLSAIFDGGWGSGQLYVGFDIRAVTVGVATLEARGEAGFFFKYFDKSARFLPRWLRSRPVRRLMRFP
jgi:hypothetical protein